MYRAWNERLNGIRSDYFGAVNLLGPRAIGQSPADKNWNNAFTFSQFRFQFLKESYPK